tara:strand:- start:269 stop:508 length:240 start_codon:yes stop_codon:yes gene_type:complete
MSQNDNSRVYSEFISRLVARMVNVNDESRSICLVPDVNATVISSLPVVLPVVSCAFVDAEKAMVERTSNVVKIKADFFL